MPSAEVEEEQLEIPTSNTMLRRDIKIGASFLIGLSPLFDLFYVYPDTTITALFGTCHD
jgi:hypothetical protein